MRTLIQKLREDFEYLIIDSPPFMAVTDPVVLSTFLDGVILVTRYNKTPKELVARGKQKFIEVQGRLIGVMINAVNLKQEEGYYSNSYTGYNSRPPSQGIEASDFLVGASSNKED